MHYSRGAGGKVSNRELRRFFDASQKCKKYLGRTGDKKIILNVKGYKRGNKDVIGHKRCFPKKSSKGKKPVQAPVRRSTRARKPVQRLGNGKRRMYIRL